MNDGAHWSAVTPRFPNAAAQAASTAARARSVTARELDRATGDLARAAIARMDETLPWYRAMPAEQRSWVGLVAQAGIAAFVEWYRHPDQRRAITGEIFGTAPRELARTVSLQQTVEMVRITIGVVEEAAETIAAPANSSDLREAVLVYAREVAFAAAQVYAQAAEARGAWDARLEAMVVDALMRGEADEALRSRAAALGWGSPDSVTVVIGTPPDDEPEAVVDGVRRAARYAGLDVLVAVQGDRLVAVLGGAPDPLRASRALLAQFGPGPIVIGPPVPDLMSAAPFGAGSRGRTRGVEGLADRTKTGAGERPAARTGDRRRPRRPPAADRRRLLCHWSLPAVDCSRP